MSFDLYFQPKEEANITGFKIFTSGFNRSIAVRGPWKLLTQWLKRFMTTKGSDPLRPDEGTDFPNLIGSNVTSISDIRDIVLLSIQDCNDQVYSIQETVPPDEDEQLDVAVLDDIQTGGEDTVVMYISISNVAGNTVQVRLPLLSTRT